MAHSKDTDNAVPAIGGIMGSVALAMILSTVAAWGAGYLGAAEKTVRFIDLTVMFAVLIAMPVSLLQDRAPRSVLLRKGLVGLAGGLAVAALFTFAIGPAEPTQAVAPEADSEPGTRLFWIVLAMFLIMLLMFAMPMLDRYLKPRKEGALPVAQDIQISAVFPIYMTLSMGLNLLVLAALWLSGAPVSVTLLLLGVVVLLAMSEVWSAGSEDLPDLDCTEWGARAPTAASAWAGLRMALRPTVTSALFLGTVSYISLQAALPWFDIETGDQMEPLAILLPLLTGAGIMLAGFTVLLGLTTLAIAGLTVLLARSRGENPLAMAELALQTQARLLMGGIHHVRPDLDSD